MDMQTQACQSDAVAMTNGLEVTFSTRLAPLMVWSWGWAEKVQTVSLKGGAVTSATSIDRAIATCSHTN